MSDSETYQPLSLWDKVVLFFKNDLKTDAARSQMARHFPQFITHEKRGNEFVIGVSENSLKEYFEPLYTDALQHALMNAGEVGMKVVFEVTDVKPVVTRAPKAAPQNTLAGQKAVVQKAPTPAQIQTAFRSAQLNENYTFENFVKGPSNNFAHAIATAVAKDPGGTTNNPFFIWGGTGLGKTHLMQAIGHKVLQNFTGKTVCYITSEEFLNEYVNALSNNTGASDALSAFRTRYRSIDLLLIDDVQFIVGKKQIQEEFFNTYNTLMSKGKQIVMTCDVPPQKLLGLEERLISRFQQGIVIEIELPSYETRLAILRFKARSCKHVIPECALTYIVENIRSSVRAMEGALNLVEVFLEANPGMELTSEMVRELLKNLAEEETVKRRLSVDEIVRGVCTAYGVTYADILSANRSQPLSTARQVAMFLSRKLTGNSLPAVAEHFKRNHATVHHGSQAIQERLKVETELKAIVSKIVTDLGRKPSEIWE